MIRSICSINHFQKNDSVVICRHGSLFTLMLFASACLTQYLTYREQDCIKTMEECCTNVPLVGHTLKMKYLLISILSLVSVAHAVYFHRFLRPIKPKHFEERGLTTDQIRQLVEKDAKLRALYCDVKTIPESKLQQLKNSNCTTSAGNEPPEVVKCEEDYFKGLSLDEIRKKLCKADQDTSRKMHHDIYTCIRKAMSQNPPVTRPRPHSSRSTKCSSCSYRRVTTTASVSHKQMTAQRIFEHNMNNMRCYEKILAI